MTLTAIVMVSEILGTKLFSAKNVLFLKSLYGDKTFFVARMILENSPLNIFGCGSATVAVIVTVAATLMHSDIDNDNTSVTISVGNYNCDCVSHHSTAYDSPSESGM